MSAQHLSSLRLGASGEQAGSHRRAELCTEPHSKYNQGPLSVRWAMDKASHSKGKATGLLRG